MALSTQKEANARSRGHSEDRRGLLLTQESGRPPTRQEGQRGPCKGEAFSRQRRRRRGQARSSYLGEGAEPGKEREQRRREGGGAGVTGGLRAAGTVLDGAVRFTFGKVHCAVCGENALRGSQAHSRGRSTGKEGTCVMPGAAGRGPHKADRICIRRLDVG